MWSSVILFASLLIFKIANSVLEKDNAEDAEQDASENDVSGDFDQDGDFSEDKGPVMSNDDESAESTEIEKDAETEEDTGGFAIMSGTDGSTAATSYFEVV